MAQENDTNYNNDSQEHILELVLPFLPVRDVFHVTLVSRHFAISMNNDLTIGRLKYERTIRIFPKVDSVPATSDLMFFVPVPPKFVFPSGNVVQDPRDEPMFDSWSNSKKANSIVTYWTLFEKFYDSVPKPPVDDWQVDDDDDDAFVEAVWDHYARELAISQAPLRRMNDYFHPQASSFVPWNLLYIDNAENRRDPVVVVIYCVCLIYFTDHDALIPDGLDHREAAHYRPGRLAALTILVLVFALVIQGEFFHLPNAEL